MSSLVRRNSAPAVLEHVPQVAQPAVAVQQQPQGNAQEAAQPLLQAPQGAQDQAELMGVDPEAMEQAAQVHAGADLDGFAELLLPPGQEDAELDHAAMPAVEPQGPQQAVEGPEAQGAQQAPVWQAPAVGPRPARGEPGMLGANRADARADARDALARALDQAEASGGKEARFLARVGGALAGFDDLAADEVALKVAVATLDAKALELEDRDGMGASMKAVVTAVHRLRVVAEAELRQLTSAQSGPDRRPLGSGAVGSVTEVQMGGRARAFKGVEGPIRSQAAHGAGIDLEHPRLEHRAVAFAEVAAAVAPNLCPSTQFACLEEPGTVMDLAEGQSVQQSMTLEERYGVTFGPDGQAQADREEDLVRYQRAQGSIQGVAQLEEMGEHQLAAQSLADADLQRHGDAFTTHVARDVDLTTPALQRQLADMQVLDWVTANVDRHAGNYHVQGDKLTLIDNDLSFGKGLVKLEQLGTVDFAFCHNKGGLPPVIDKTTADRIRRLDLKRDVLSRVEGLVSPKEAAALKDRWKVLLGHIKRLEREGRVITKWDEHSLREMMNAQTYLKRDVEYVRDRHGHGGDPVDGADGADDADGEEG